MNKIIIQKGLFLDKQAYIQDGELKKIKIINKNQVIDIGTTLSKYKIDRWKLFKFMPLRNFAINNSKTFEICNEEFECIVSKIKNIYGKTINIRECKEDKIQSNYLLINSVGDFIITDDFKDKKIYSIEENDTEILNKYLYEE